MEGACSIDPTSESLIRAHKLTMDHNHQNHNNMY